MIIWSVSDVLTCPERYVVDRRHDRPGCPQPNPGVWFMTEPLIPPQGLNGQTRYAVSCDGIGIPQTCGNRRCNVRGHRGSMNRNVETRLQQGHRGSEPCHPGTEHDNLCLRIHRPQLFDAGPNTQDVVPYSRNLYPTPFTVSMKSSPIESRIFLTCTSTVLCVT